LHRFGRCKTSLTEQTGGNEGLQGQKANAHLIGVQGVLTTKWLKQIEERMKIVAQPKNGKTIWSLLPLDVGAPAVEEDSIAVEDTRVEESITVTTAQVRIITAQGQELCMLVRQTHL
jgi:hypothetical protein